MRQSAESAKAALKGDPAALTCVSYMEIIEDIRDLPGIEADCIHIWGLDVREYLDRMEALRAVLNDQERQKADRYHREADRHA